jgi:hypothetical protein
MTVRWFHIAIAAGVLAGCLYAKSTEEPLETLKTRAESARPQDQPHLFATIARREVNEADRFYTVGDIASATKAVDELVRYAARAAEAAQKTGKQLKSTEIVLRETARRLNDVSKTLNFDDRTYVEAAVKQVEKSRQQILDQMFGLPSKETKK